MVVSGLPEAGSVLNSSKFTFSGMSIPDSILRDAVQVRVTSDPKGGMGLGTLLASIRETGAGTANKNMIICVHH